MSTPSSLGSLGLDLFTVFGFWAQTAERWCDTYGAGTARGAEDQAQLHASEVGGTLRVCRVVLGDLWPVDKYTAYVDITDVRNLERDNLELDMADSTLGTDPYYTVFGMAVPEGYMPGTPEIWLEGERYGDIVPISSPGAAEDVARSRLREARPGYDLLVCTVLAGQYTGSDAYATFCNPDIRAA